MSLSADGQAAPTSSYAPDPAERLIEENQLKWRVAKDSFAKITREWRTDCTLVDELYSKDLLDDIGHMCYYRDRRIDSHGAFGRAMKEVLGNIQKDSLCWDKFLQALKDSDLESLATQLESDLKSRMRGYQGKYNMTSD